MLLRFKVVFARVSGRAFPSPVTARCSGDFISAGKTGSGAFMDDASDFNSLFFLLNPEWVQLIRVALIHCQQIGRAHV